MVLTYVDSSVALARLLFEARAPVLRFWQQRLASSRLLEYEVWNRMRAYDPGNSNEQAARQMLFGIELFDMERSVLARALEPWPRPLRTLDSLHLATAEYLRRQGELVEFASYDKRLLEAALGSVEIWDSLKLDIVIQAWDGPICAERGPVGEDGTALPGEEDGPRSQR